MLTITSKTPSPSPLIDNQLPKFQNPTAKPSNSCRIPRLNSPIYANCYEPTYQTEKGLQFEIEDAFFNHESATRRDLGVVALYKLSKQHLRVLDAMCRCGIRSLRYLAEAEADFVMANEGNDSRRWVILNNLKQANLVSGDEKRRVVTHFDANRVMSECYLKRNFFDLIDIDSFASGVIGAFLRTVFNIVKRDGLLYLTSTDGYSSGDHRPNNSLAAYGAYIRTMPYSNEVAFRMLIGGAIREASAQGKLTGVFPVKRPLAEMLNLAEKWGWVGNGTGTYLENLLNRMIDESDPRLPFGYIKLDEIVIRSKMNYPALRSMMSPITKEGNVANRSHIASNVIKTDCPMTQCTRIAKEIMGQ